jgi:hypothetical protein
VGARAPFFFGENMRSYSIKDLIKIVMVEQKERDFPGSFWIEYGYDFITILHESTGQDPRVDSYHIGRVELFDVERIVGEKTCTDFEHTVESFLLESIKPYLRNTERSILNA